MHLDLKVVIANVIGLAIINALPVNSWLILEAGLGVGN